MVQKMTGDVPQLSRRELIVAGGIGLVGGTLLSGCAGASSRIIRTKPGPDSEVHQSPENIGFHVNGQADGAEKTTYLPPQQDKDPVSYSLAENLFWTDILMEHGKFFAMLMPGDELREARSQAEKFSKSFADRFALARSNKLTKEDYVRFNRGTIDLVKPFIDFKHKMKEEQSAGKLKSLVWPLFFEHTAREAERFVARLEVFNKGAIEIDKAEAIPFWAGIMGEHADFVAHLLDPAERKLMDQALKSADKFYSMRDKRELDEKKAGEAGQEILDFKMAAAKGINAGKIKSIIHPTLADHVRREAVKFIDEVKRIA
jgi:hypothetical protein